MEIRYFNLNYIWNGVNISVCEEKSIAVNVYGSI